MAQLTRRGTARLRGEKRTVTVMVYLYCAKNHAASLEACPECRELLDYAFQRLDACPFMNDKPACSNCRVHCYEPTMGERMRQVMRFSGPRMLSRHPVLAIRHLADVRRSAKGQ